ncbi:MAG: DedA family protein [Clostridia bacterium]|nr:DedA family protein [Clostridia bacterium]
MTNLFTNILEYLLTVIEQANLITLFFSLTFGIVFAPVNRETIIVFMAVVAAANTINPIIAFFITAGATYFGYSLGFFVGRGFKAGLADKFLTDPSPLTKKRIARSYQLLDKYGTWAIIFSYFVPGVRHFLPVILGVGTMPSTQFLITSKVGSIIWTASFFLPGYFFGDFWTSFF